MAALALALFVGCASFEATRSQKFVDESGAFVHVDYGADKEPRTSVFVLSNGVQLPFKSKLKVRVELPDGTRFTVDGSAQLLAQCAQVQFGGDMAAQADCYYALVARLAEVPQVDIVGHFDLITKFDEPHTRYPIVPPSARAAMERLIRAGKIFEINTGAISRGYRQTPYPAELLLRLLREMDGKILFTADAHRACDVAFGYAEAVELACRCGFDTFWRLTEEGFVPAPLHRALT